jgi:hypothetical protein
MNSNTDLIRHAERGTELSPDSLAEALGDRSLGNPAVVSDLVGGFVTHVGQLAADCWDDKLTGEELDAQIRETCLNLGRTFQGEDPNWTATTWNTSSLGGLRSKARALLASTRVNFGQDDNFEPQVPVAGLFYTLAKQTLSAFKAASRGEEDHPLPQTLRFMISTLLGLPETPK